MEVMTPTVNVTANPLMVPVAIQYRMTAVMSEVILESKMAENALSKELRIATRKGRPISFSSRRRS